MGMPSAFSGKTANFEGIAGVLPMPLYIHHIFHKAFIAVDEKGTEAAAVTAVVGGEESIDPEPIVVTIDRPFIFLIRDNKTGTILFMGRVLDPR